MSNVCDEDRAGARKVLDSLKSQSCSNPKEVSLRSYGKYEQLMFGTEYEDRESDDPTFGLKGKAPKANLCRKKWTDEEEAEIAAGVDLASMEQQPDSFVARELLLACFVFSLPEARVFSLETLSASFSLLWLDSFMYVSSLSLSSEL